MAFTVAQWHERYLEQVRWTAGLREFILQQIDYHGAGPSLEVGCGTGALLSAIPGENKFGLDIVFSGLNFVQNSEPSLRLVNGDAIKLPFADCSFELTYCHYLLLWLNSPELALREMVRVTQKGGYVIAFAEPDHASRVDAPVELAYLGRLQSRALEVQGANLESGRQLAGLFSQAGFSYVKIGISGFQKETKESPAWFESEWQILEHDLSGSLDRDQLDHLKERDRQAWLDGSRVLWIPTFYAIGQV